MTTTLDTTSKCDIIREAINEINRLAQYEMGENYKPCGCGCKSTAQIIDGLKELGGDIILNN